MVRCPICHGVEVNWTDTRMKGEDRGEAKIRRTYVCQNPECRHVWRRYEVVSQRMKVKGDERTRPLI